MSSFFECGFAAWLILLMSCVALAGGIIGIFLAIFKPRYGAAFGVVALGVTMLVPACGVLGTMKGRQTVDEALAGGSINPAHVEEIRKAGYSEAATCTSLGLGFGILPGALSVLGLGLALARRKARAPASLG